MVRARDSHDKRIRIWDMGREERFHEPTKRKFFQEVPMPGAYLDAVIFQIKWPYSLSFNAYGPNLNNPDERNERFWGGRIGRDNFETEWAGKVDIGPDLSGHSQEWYEGMYEAERAKGEAEQERRNRRNRY